MSVPGGKFAFVAGIKVVVGCDAERDAKGKPG